MDTIYIFIAIQVGTFVHHPSIQLVAAVQWRTCLAVCMRDTHQSRP